MSKQNPNQDYYKTGGRSQSEGPDRGDAGLPADKHPFNQAQPGKDPDHPAFRRAKKK